MLYCFQIERSPATVLKRRMAVASSPCIPSMAFSETSGSLDSANRAATAMPAMETARYTNWTFVKLLLLLPLKKYLEAINGPMKDATPLNDWQN
jgi:hypothetical protein